ncbi:YciI family protein [Paenibacillus sp.]|jgi:uncharacterized protein YciI|uniref:YciI family protein n=1 Tax=Paenibacillus sp. TaxID=58172 RepID=UPI00283205AF|nr:YciI family protein [Paenibacillus sp.]MDR0270736.1 YciI family protein [Paenibacillus sp.]
MKKFVAILKEKRVGELSSPLLYRHVDHLRNLTHEGKLQLCGPFRDSGQAIQILICNDYEEAVLLVENDPFIKDGYYAAYELNELVEANEANNWLI